MESLPDYFQLGDQFGELGIYFHFGDMLVNILDLSDGEFRKEVQSRIDGLAHRKRGVKIAMIEQIERLKAMGFAEPLPPKNPAEFYAFSQEFTEKVAKTLEGSEEWLYYALGLRFGNVILHLQILSLVYRLLMSQIHHGVLRTSLTQLAEKHQDLCVKLAMAVEHPDIDEHLKENMELGLTAVAKLGEQLVVPDDAEAAKRSGIAVQDAIRQLSGSKTVGIVLWEKKLLGIEGPLNPR